MDEAAVRKHAEQHGAAIVARDIARAGSDLTPEAQAEVGPVMKALPRPATAAEVTSLEPDGDEFVAVTAYRGENSEARVEARWAEVEGRPRIVAIRLV